MAHCSSVRARRFAVLFASTLLASGLGVRVNAQSAPPVLKSASVFSSIDENGVDLVQGRFELAVPVITAGAGAEAIAMIYATASGKMRADTYRGYVIASYQSPLITVNLDGDAEMFTTSGWPNGVITSNQGEGSTLEIVMGPNGSVANGVSKYIYTKADGTVATFEVAKYPNGISFTPPVNAAITILRRPNGDTESFAYKTISGTAATQQGTIMGVVVSRTQSVTNNRGYMVKYEYPGGVVTNNPSAVTAINTTVDYCDPVADSCTTTQTWPKVQITRTSLPDNTLGLAGITDPLNRSMSISYATTGPAAGYITGVKRPGSAADNIVIGYDTSGFVASVTKDGVAYAYNYVVSGDVATMTRTNPDGGTLVVTSPLSVGRPSSVRDPLNRTTSYAYDANGRLGEVTYPEGNKVQYAYDSRGNLTQSRAISKTPGTPPDIVTSATYPASCTAIVSCNKPASVTDANGNVSEYTYDATHGGVLTVTAPAPTAGGARPQARYHYDALQAYYKDSTGAVTASGQPVYRLTEVTRCQTGSTCAGTGDEVKSAIAYGPQVAGIANNLLPMSASTASGDGAFAAMTSMTYDVIGNLLTSDGPLAGTADTTRYRYDAARQLIGIVGPDPDGSGGRKPAAERRTYNSDGQVTANEVGNVTDQSDSAWTALTVSQKLITTYDANARLVKSEMKSGTTTYGVTQYSYDSKGRSECTAVRMDPAQWGSQSSVCTPQTTGPNGPDRVSRTSYDTADQVTKIITAFGTPEASDDVSYTYTNNGKLLTAADANGNLTTYVYDGLDRLFQSQYPSATTVGTSNAADWEGWAYDANGNIIQQRRRDGQVFINTWDALNRATVLRHWKPGVGVYQTITQTFDLLGRLTQSSDAAGHNAAFTYDALGRKLSEGNSFGAMTSQYDAAGRRTRLTWSDGYYVTYDYDVTGKMTAIRENGAASGSGVLGTYAYDDLGRLTTLTRGNGVITNFGFDPVSRLASLGHDLAGTLYDTGTSFSYNPAGQIGAATRNNDRYAWNGHYNVNRDYTVNGLNQLTTSGSTTLGYDARGNLTTSGVNSFSYDILNQLRSGPWGGGYNYDPLGRLDAVTSATDGSNTQTFLYDGDDLTTEYQNSGPTILNRYVHGPGADAPLVWYEGAGTGVKRWLVPDERGSVIAVTNSSGKPLAINSYDEFGIPAATNLGRFGYTGQTWLSEVGMWYYKARVYSPTLGRFMQTDPIGYADGMNSYNYVGSDPVNRLDPTGLAESDIVVTGSKPEPQPTPNFGPISVSFGGGVPVPQYQSGSYGGGRDGPADPQPGRGFSAADLNAAKKKKSRQKMIPAFWDTHVPRMEGGTCPAGSRDVGRAGCLNAEGQKRQDADTCRAIGILSIPIAILTAPILAEGGALIASVGAQRALFLGTFIPGTACTIFGP